MQTFTTSDAMRDWPHFCHQVYDVAVKAASPSVCLAGQLPDPLKYTAVKVIAVGKAAPAMAAVVEEAWPEVRLSGVVICPYGTVRQFGHLDVIESAHPVPDGQSVRAAERALEVARSTGHNELLLVLLSGGGSSLMCLPAAGMTLAQKQKLVERLLRSGAPIGEINKVRRYFSAIKGGKLLAAAQNAAEVITLAISDVVGDDPATIASGPTVPAAIEQHDIDGILEHYDLAVPSIALQNSSILYPNNDFHIVGSNSAAITAAQGFLENTGFSCINIGADVIGEASEVARQHVIDVNRAIAKEQALLGGARPLAFISGGELTVTVKGTGQGGPNQEYLLAFAVSMARHDIYGFAADTDGMDGVGGAAGAWFSPLACSQGVGRALEPKKYLLNNDSYNYFKKLSSLFKVKPTMTNVNDLRVICWFPDQVG